MFGCIVAVADGIAATVDAPTGHDLIQRSEECYRAHNPGGKGGEGARGWEKLCTGNPRIDVSAYEKYSQIWKKKNIL